MLAPPYSTYFTRTPCSGARHLFTGGEPCWSAERHVRYQIDRAVGRALFDRSFAARLLAEPALAVAPQVYGATAQHVAIRQIRAQNLLDFASQMFAQLWGPASRTHVEVDLNVHDNLSITPDDKRHDMTDLPAPSA
jgi:hypothetical protein